MVPQIENGQDLFVIATNFKVEEQEKNADMDMPEGIEMSTKNSNKGDAKQKKGD
jgi:hypothetical protein